VQTLWKWISRYLPNALFEIAEVVYNVPAARRLERALAAQRYDLLYERYAFFLVAGAFKAAKFEVPFVLEANEVSGVQHRARRQSFLRLCGLFERALFRRCRGILTVSSHLRNSIVARGVPFERVRVVPNAVDIEKFGSVRRDAALEAQLGLHGKQVIAVAGWFDTWDRLDFLIDALAKLVVQFPQARLLVVGDGPVLAGARQRIADLGLGEHAVFVGAVPRSEVLRYLSLADVAVLPHSNDFGSPVVMFEFMGLRVPVVAPRLPPIEDVHVDGSTALLFTPLDLSEFVARIAALLAAPELRREIAARAFDKLTRAHTWERNAMQILCAAHIDAAQPRS
jgi:glycosyltransferase involved in cell wall biosynthesis